MSLIFRERNMSIINNVRISNFNYFIWILIIKSLACLKIHKNVIIEKAAWAYMWRGAYLWRTYVRRNTIFSKAWLQKYFCSPLTKIYVCKTTNILSIFEFTKVSGRKIVLSYRLSASVLYFFMKNHLSLTQS